jgi:hypothetical protein
VTRRTIAEHDGLIVARPTPQAPGTVVLCRADGSRVALNARDLQWLVHTGAPAALAAIVRDYDGPDQPTTPEA